MRRRLLVAAAAVVVVVVVAVAVARIEHQPAQRAQPRPPATGPGATPGPSPTPVPSPTPGLSATVAEVRTATPPVPGGFRVIDIGFGDLATGYALFAGREGAAALAVTFDGGLSWVDRPAPPVRGGRLVITEPQAVTIVDEGGWYVSRDTGRTFTRGTGRPPIAADPVPPTKPPLGEVIQVHQAPNGRYWAAGVRDRGALATAYSDDAGRTWRRLPDLPDVFPDNRPLVSAPDGSDVWLFVAFPSQGGYSDSRVWRFADNQWRPAAAAEQFSVVTAAFAIGGGVLVGARPAGAPVALVDGGARAVVPAGPAAVTEIAQMPDGNLQARPGTRTSAYLCECRGMKARWVLVGLSGQS